MICCLQKKDIQDVKSLIGTLTDSVARENSGLAGQLTELKQQIEEGNAVSVSYFKEVTKQIDDCHKETIKQLETKLEELDILSLS